MTEYIEREFVLAKKFNLESRLHEPIPIVLASEIERIPAADVRPVVRGQWKIVKEPFGAGYVKCSVCAFTHCPPYKVGGLGITHNFCPNCGADMRPSEVDS